MNNNPKVIELVDRIEAAFRELVEVTGEQHISAFILNGSFLMQIVNEYDETILDIYHK